MGNEGKAGRFYILPMLKKTWKSNVKPEDFKFWKRLINLDIWPMFKTVENEGETVRF